jgi:hypothetical protein
MRVVKIATILLVGLPLMAASAYAQTTPTAPRTPPAIGETKDADIKAEYLEAIPYKPCPANVRFPNGRQACLGLPRN